MAEGCTAQDAANVVAKLNGRYDLLCIVYTMLDDGYRWSTCGQYFGHGVDERKQNMMNKWLGGEK